VYNVQDYLTALHVAAHCGNVRSAEILLKNHCTIDARALVCLYLSCIFTPLCVFKWSNASYG